MEIEVSMKGSRLLKVKEKTEIVSPPALKTDFHGNCYSCKKGGRWKGRGGEPVTA